MKINLTYKVTPEQFERLSGSIDLESMVRIGRILNLMTVLSEMEKSMPAYRLGEISRRREILRVKSRLVDEAAEAIADLFPIYDFALCFESLREMHFGDDDHTEGPQLDEVETIPFRLYSDCPAIDKRLNELDWAGRDLLKRPATADTYTFRLTPDLAELSATIRELENQYASAAVEFIEGITWRYGIERMNEKQQQRSEFLAP